MYTIGSATLRRCEVCSLVIKHIKMVSGNILYITSLCIVSARGIEYYKYDQLKVWHEMLNRLQIQRHTFTEQNTELTRSSCLRTFVTNRPAF